MSKRYQLSLVLLFCSICAYGQDTNRRFSFAKSYFGLDVSYIPGVNDSPFLNENAQAETFDRSALLSPAINFGATHFWGHADFYVSIPLSTIGLEEDAVDNTLSQRVFTGLRYYPVKLSPRTIRPFIGYKFSAHRYEQNTENSTTVFTQVKSIFDIGLGYRTNKLYAYIGYNRILNPEFDLYLSRNESFSADFPSSFITLGANLQMEFTRTNRTEAFTLLMDKLGSTNRYGWFFGAGPSSAFTMTNSPRIEENYPFLNQRVMPNVFPDIALGYHFSKWDIITNLAFRPITLNREALSFEQALKRRSVVLEVAKGLVDYHGFVPFVGLGMSYEQISLKEKDNGNTIYNRSFDQVSPILTFGWDIRPNKKADWLVLRTNLRYAPFLNIEEGDNQMKLNQLEFNFIQVVIYPQRKKQY